MANRIRSNVLIIDTNGLASFPGGGTQALVSAVAFWASDSTGALQIAFAANSADVVVNMASPVNQPNTTTLRFPEETYLQAIYIKTLVAGTAYMYFN